MPSRTKARIAAIAVAFLILLIHLPYTRDAVLFDDSADYMRAAQAPLLATWLNTNSATPFELSRRMQMADSPFRAHPWDAMYAAGDNAALRHFHGPVTFYAEHMVKLAAKSDSAVRMLALVVASTTCGLMVWFLSRFGVPWMLAAALGFFAGMEGRYLEVSIDPTPHGWYILFVLCFLAAIALFLQTRRAHALYLASALLACCCATLEFSVIVVATIPLACAVLFLMRRDRAWPPRDQLVKAVGLFFASTFALWPGGWLRGGYLVNYGELSATVLLKNKSAFGERFTTMDLYQTLLAHHLLETEIFFAVALGAAFLLFRRRLSIASVVFLSYTLLAFGLGIADHFKLSTYVSEFMLFLIASAGLVFIDATKDTARKSAWSTLFSLLLLIGAATEWRGRGPMWSGRPWLAQEIVAIKQNVPPGETVLTNRNREAFALYLPQDRFELTTTPASNVAHSAARTQSVHFGIFDSAVPLPVNVHPITAVPTRPGHSDVVWQTR